MTSKTKSGGFYSSNSFNSNKYTFRRGYDSSNLDFNEMTPEEHKKERKGEKGDKGEDEEEESKTIVDERKNDKNKNEEDNKEEAINEGKRILILNK